MRTTNITVRNHRQPAATVTTALWLGVGLLALFSGCDGGAGSVQRLDVQVAGVTKPQVQGNAMCSPNKPYFFTGKCYAEMAQTSCPSDQYKKFGRQCMKCSDGYFLEGGKCYGEKRNISVDITTNKHKCPMKKKSVCYTTNRYENDQGPDRCCWCPLDHRKRLKIKKNYDKEGRFSADSSFCYKDEKKPEVINLKNPEGSGESLYSRCRLAEGENQYQCGKGIYAHCATHTNKFGEESCAWKLPGKPYCDKNPIGGKVSCKNVE